MNRYVTPANVIYINGFRYILAEPRRASDGAVIAAVRAWRGSPAELVGALVAVERRACV